MANIYKLAEYVVAWLGPEADGSALALRTLDTIGSMIVANLSTVTMKPSDKAGVAGQSHWADTTATMPFGPGDLDTVHHPVDRPWFERLLIQQEITLATGAILSSGFDNITWTRFRTAMFCLNIKAPRQTEVFTKYGDAWERLKLIYRICYQYWKYPLIGQMNLTSRCKCSDPRDRIFGVLSISQFPTGLEIKADYKKSTVEVYQEVALQYYQRDLYMLTCCEFQNSMAGGPTWVPNWAIRNSAAEHLPWTRAGGSSNPLVEYMGGGLLQVIGMRVASIKSANLLGRLNTEITTTIRTYAPPTSKESLEILCQTLRCEMFGDWYYPPRISYQNYEESLEALKIVLENDPTSPLPAQIQAQVQRYMFFAATYSMGRSIFWTSDGRLGLGPGLTQKTDEIVVFIGCPNLMILRPSGGGKYWVVGGCFIHDLMDSEALLGPPPEHYQRLKMVPQSEQEVFHEAYRNNLTGQFHDEDPRLAALPSRLRNDGVRQVYPTGFPEDGQEGDYMGYMTWTKGLLGVGEKVEIMRNDLQPFLLE
jgi:hypothetical protein